MQPEGEGAGVATRTRVSMPVITTDKAVRDLRVSFLPMQESLRAQADALVVVALERMMAPPASRL